MGGVPNDLEENFVHPHLAEKSTLSLEETVLKKKSLEETRILILYLAISKVCNVSIKEYIFHLLLWTSVA